MANDMTDAVFLDDMLYMYTYEETDSIHMYIPSQQEVEDNYDDDDIEVMLELWEYLNDYDY